MAQYLFDVQQKNRLEQKGLLKRFSVNCYGEQETLEAMRNTKAKKYAELKGKRNSKEYESWFLRYIPFENKMDKEEKKADVDSGKEADKDEDKEEEEADKEQEKDAKAKPVKMKKTVTWKKAKKPMAKTKKNKGKKGLFGFF